MPTIRVRLRLTRMLGDSATSSLKTIPMKASRLITLALVTLLSGCGLIHDDHLVGRYHLMAENVPEQMKVSYYFPHEEGWIGRIPETVFAVGWDKDYIVAKQHPKNNRRVTHFYYLDITRDSADAGLRASVTGPLTEAEFIRKQAELHLPTFRRTINSLE